jgi:hypothetical protein
VPGGYYFGSNLLEILGIARQYRRLARYPMYTTRTPPRTLGPLSLAVASRAICPKYEDLPPLTTLSYDFRRIVAPKVAGSSPVGHLLSIKMPHKDKSDKVARDQKVTAYLRRTLRRYKTLKGFVDCGYRQHHAALEFDHVPERGAKVLSIGNMARYSRNRIKKEHMKCDIVCGNCHNIRNFMRRGLE